jgi:hypothetical protein
LYRTSILGRKDLIKLAFSDNTKKAIDAIPDTYTSRVIEIFNTTLKVLGIQIDFVDDDDRVKVLNNEDLKVHKLNDRSFVCTDYEFYLIEKIDEMRTAILDKYPVITKNELNRILTDMLKDNSFITDGMTKELYELIDRYNNTELEKIREDIGDEVNKMEGIPTEEPEESKEETTKDETSKEEKPKKKRATKKKVTK